MESTGLQRPPRLAAKWKIGKAYIWTLCNLLTVSHMNVWVGQAPISIPVKIQPIYSGDWQYIQQQNWPLWTHGICR